MITVEMPGMQSSLTNKVLFGGLSYNVRLLCGNTGGQTMLSMVTVGLLGHKAL